MRKDEQIFLGMALKDRGKDDPNPVARSKELKQVRKKKQQENTWNFELVKVDLKDLIHKTQGPDLHGEMLNDRRDWVQEFMKENGMMPPEEVSDYYVAQEPKITPEEERALKLLEEEKAKEKAKKKKEEAEKEKEKEKAEKKDKKDKGKKKKKKKGGDDDDPSKNLALMGPSEVVYKFEEF